MTEQIIFASGSAEALARFSCQKPTPTDGSRKCFLVHATIVEARGGDYPVAAAAESKLIGTHQLLVDDDLVSLRLCGDFSLSEANQVNAQIEAVLTRLGHVFVMVDQTQAGKTSPEARRCFVEWNRKHRHSGSVLFGGSAAARAVAALVVSAIRIFRPDNGPTVFTATEVEARAWITQQRAKLLS